MVMGVHVLPTVGSQTDNNYHVWLIASSISQAGMPYTKQYNLCSVPYGLVQPLFGVNCSEWLWKVGCTLVYRPWPTSWLSQLDKFGRGNIVSVSASACICLHLPEYCLRRSSFFDLYSSKVWE